MVMSIDNGNKGLSDHPERTRLTPSDQLLAIFAVNIILLVWVVASFARLYNDDPPTLPTWVYLAELAILIISLSLSLLDTWWPRLRKVIEGDGSERKATPIEVNLTMLKVSVFVVTALDVAVLWQLAESTGGVLSPYAPFLPAPAIFVSFVTKRWQTIVLLSVAVAVAIGFSTIDVPHPLPDLKAYQGSAVVLVILAGMLSALQARVASTGQPLTGQGSAMVEDEPRAPNIWKGSDDDDLEPTAKT